MISENPSEKYMIPMELKGHYREMSKSNTFMKTLCKMMEMMISNDFNAYRVFLSFPLQNHN